MHCRLCGSEELVLLRKVKSRYKLKGNFIKSVFFAVRCIKCNVTHVEPLLEQDVLLGMYDEDYFQNYLDNTDDRKRYFEIF